MLFWRRKSARFKTRLSTVVETAEKTAVQTKQQFRSRPPRVVIDTSYLHQLNQPEEQYDENYVDENGVPLDQQYYEETEGEAAGESTGYAPGNEPADEYSAPEAPSVEYEAAPDTEPASQHLFDREEAAGG